MQLLGNKLLAPAHRDTLRWRGLARSQQHIPGGATRDAAGSLGTATAVLQYSNTGYFDIIVSPRTLSIQLARASFLSAQSFLPSAINASIKLRCKAHSDLRKRVRHGPENQGCNGNHQSLILTLSSISILSIPCRKTHGATAYSRPPLLQLPFVPWHVVCVSEELRGSLRASHC